MRIPLTKYGMPQVLVFPVVIMVLMACFGVVGPWWLPVWAVVSAEVVLVLLLAFVLSFFRDPKRVVPTDGNLVLSPADGVVSDIEEVDEDEFIGGRALRIGIFLSVFNTHINRAPCGVKVAGTRYRPGRFINAMNKRAGQVNESNYIHLVRLEEPQDKLIVRQVSGAIARRIVCRVGEGQELAVGEQFGMIKFGSRTELYVPVRDDIKCIVQAGCKVKAGLSVLLRYES